MHRWVGGPSTALREGCQATAQGEMRVRPTGSAGSEPLFLTLEREERDSRATLSLLSREKVATADHAKWL